MSSKFSSFIEDFKSPSISISKISTKTPSMVTKKDKKKMKKKIKKRKSSSTISTISTKKTYTYGRQKTRKRFC